MTGICVFLCIQAHFLPATKSIPCVSLLTRALALFANVLILRAHYIAVHWYPERTWEHWRLPAWHLQRIQHLEQQGSRPGLDANWRESHQPQPRTRYRGCIVSWGVIAGCFIVDIGDLIHRWIYNNSNSLGLCQVFSEVERCGRALVCNFYNFAYSITVTRYALGTQVYKSSQVLPFEA